MGKLSIEQGVENLQTCYNQSSIRWNNDFAEFVINEDKQTGQITFWKESIVPEQVLKEINSLEEKLDQFLLAMQITGNARIKTAGKPTVIYTATDGREIGISKDCPDMISLVQRHAKGEAINYMSATVDFGTLMAVALTNEPVPFPQSLPQASLEFQRLIEIFSSAECFSGRYQTEHQLRNYFLIMEELCENINPKPSDYDDIKKIRDFISHPICHFSRTKDFIKDNFLKR